MNTNTIASVTVGTYHVFGSGSSSTWFRQTRKGATPAIEFFAAIDAAREDVGHNGFVGTYEVPTEFMVQHGWEAATMYWPPCNDYSQTPQASDGWLSRDGWLGGGLEALNAKVPEFRPGYYTVRQHQGCEVPVFVETEEDHRKAILDGHEITYFKDMGDGVHELPYSWGDQAATAFALIRDGKVLDYTQGCGDGTPYLTKTAEECLKDGKLHTSCSRDDLMRDLYEEEQAFMDMLGRLGLENEFYNLNNAPYSAQNQEEIEKVIRRVNEAIALAKANARANADATGILWRLLNHYRRGMNPLKSLRKEKGGTWTFHREDPRRGGNMSENTVVYHGDNWWVTWVKK